MWAKNEFDKNTVPLTAVQQPLVESKSFWLCWNPWNYAARRKPGSWKGPEHVSILTVISIKTSQFTKRWRFSVVQSNDRSFSFVFLRKRTTVWFDTKRSKAIMVCLMLVLPIVTPFGMFAGWLSGGGMQTVAVVAAVGIFPCLAFTFLMCNISSRTIASAAVEF